jgi:hypothetical protein
MYIILDGFDPVKLWVEISRLFLAPEKLIGGVLLYLLHFIGVYHVEGFVRVTARGGKKQEFVRQVGRADRWLKLEWAMIITA